MFTPPWVIYRSCLHCGIGYCRIHLCYYEGTNSFYLVNDGFSSKKSRAVLFGYPVLKHNSWVKFTIVAYEWVIAMSVQSPLLDALGYTQNF